MGAEQRPETEKGTKKEPQRMISPIRSKAERYFDMQRRREQIRVIREDRGKDRQFKENWRKDMTELNIRVTVDNNTRRDTLHLVPITFGIGCWKNFIEFDQKKF